MQVDDEKSKQQNLSWAIDRSANERTFLAWMRAAIALMGFGFVIVRLRVVQLPVGNRSRGVLRKGEICCIYTQITVGC